MMSQNYGAGSIIIIGRKNDRTSDDRMDNNRTGDIRMDNDRTGDDRMDNNRTAW